MTRRAQAQQKVTLGERQSEQDLCRPSPQKVIIKASWPKDCQQ